VEFQAKVEAELAKWERDGKRRESIAAGARVFNFSLIEETKVHSDPTDKDKKKAMRFPRDAKYEALRKAGMGGETVLNTAERTMTRKGKSKKKTTVKEKFKASGLPKSTKKFNLKPEAKQSNPLKSLWESHAASKKKKEEETPEEETPEEISVLPLPPNRRRLPLPKSLTTTRDVILHSSEEDLYIKSNLKSQPSVRGPSKEQPVNRIPLVNNQKSDGFDVLNAYLEQRMRQKEEERLERERQQELGDVNADADIEDEDDEEEEEEEIVD
jgi:hypothetical protein